MQIEILYNSRSTHKDEQQLCAGQGGTINQKLETKKIKFVISDTRESRDYNESHVITAKYAPRVRRINNNNNNNNINNNNIIIIIIVITFQFFISLFKCQENML